MIPVTDIGIDVVSTAAEPAARTASRIGGPVEIATFGVSGALAAKEAATKVIGGRAPGASLLDVVLASVPAHRAGPAVGAMLQDLGVGEPSVLGWQFSVAERFRSTVIDAGGCVAGRGVIGVRQRGDLVALCLGRNQEGAL